MQTTLQQFDLLLEGRMTAPLSGKYFDCINPSNGEVFARVANAGEMDMEIAISAARLAFDHGRWPNLSVAERGSYLIKIGQAIREHAKELADLECTTTGKTIKHTTFIDVPTAAETFEYFGNLKQGLSTQKINLKDPLSSTVEREPVGVAALIIPWNYPLIEASWKMAPALLAGNTIILKPSSTGCAAVMALAKIMAEIGFPKGVVNIVASTDEKAKDLLIKHPQVDMISFTGGTSTGEKVMAQASKGVKKISLELGGKSPNIVFADCDMEAAIGGSLSAIFMNQGQMCTAGSRLLVEDKIYKEFTQKLIERAKTLKIGPADSFETEFGPLVSIPHRDQVLKMIEQGLKEGGKIACGGKIPQGQNPKGAYLEPTIFIDTRNNMTIAQEEIFGPVLCVIPFISVEDVIHIANDSKYGLAAMIWTKDLNKANQVAKRLRCGTVWINTYGAFPNEAPFGGYKQSGFGRELGQEGLSEYTQVKHIAIDQTPGGKSLVTSWF
jgi:acyl-CoA reductase-like NAD-dependent aldehyde dehydrogenase